jgi:serine-type D-Ala-D-Ala carboxypeptidase (penicillin-binding protein 5/6)
MLAALLLTLTLGVPGTDAGLRPLPLPPPPFLLFPAPEPPSIPARSWMVYSVDHEAVLGALEPDLPMAPASITKLMTAMIASGLIAPTDQITISAAADATPIGYEGQPDVRQGEVWVARDLLANVMVQSGNDASTAIAEAAAGSVEDFVTLMNETAAELGMTNTVFKNPHGLDDPEHLSTARDLITMGRAALDYPEVLHLALVKQVTFRVGGRVIPVDATDRDLGVFPGLSGLKTGDTANAGQVLLSYTITQHDRLVAVVLGTPDRRATTRALLAWAMTALGPRDHFFALATDTDVALSFPDWYQVRLRAGGGLDPGTPTPPERTPLTDDLNLRFREMLPELLGGDP